MEHSDCLKIPEFERYAQQQADYQKSQNGSIQRIEKKVDAIYASQQQYTEPLFAMLEKETDRRRLDVTTATDRLDCIEGAVETQDGRIGRLERYAKIPAWSWKALAAGLGLVVVVLTILTLLHVI